MISSTTLPSVSALLENIEIPDSAYETAETRYKDIGDWLGRPESSVARYDPLVFPQGSFRLGTVTRPSDPKGEYDLDLAVKLRTGVSKSSHTQKQLKEMIGAELEVYRRARGISAALDEKTRCWRLEYADKMSFHIDIVPCIPEDVRRQQMVKEAIVALDADAVTLADEVASLTVAITDKTHPHYPYASHDWNVSNPQGYGHWFDTRVRLARESVQRRLKLEKRAEVEDLPAYKLKAPLQTIVQLLKIHRDTMFADNPDGKPISIIITTLAARAYAGQEDVAEALLHVLDTMDQYVHRSSPRVPNPVNPDEDFSDKWDTPDGRRLDLEGNFYRWLVQARVDFRVIATTHDAETLEKRAENALGLRLDRQRLRERFGMALTPTLITTPQRISQAPRPWGRS